MSVANYLQQLHPYFSSATVQCNQGTPCSLDLPNVSAGSSELTTVLQFVFAAIGAIAVIIIIIAGIRFITSMGDPQSVNRARQTIIYALVGLVVAISAELIVSYVLTNV